MFEFGFNMKHDKTNSSLNIGMKDGKLSVSGKDNLYTGLSGNFDIVLEKNLSIDLQREFDSLSIDGKKMVKAYIEEGKTVGIEDIKKLSIADKESMIKILKDK